MHVQCMIMSRRILFKMRTLSDNLRRVNQNTYFALKNVFLKIILFVREGIKT